MPTSLGHAAFALGLSFAYPRKSLPLVAIPIGCVCAVLPDFDVIAFRLNIPYSAPFGHRGFFHGLLFALFIAIVATGIAKAFITEIKIITVGSYFLLASISHGVLDAFTNGGQGVALYAPFSSERIFAHFRPIVVSPIGLHSIFKPQGLMALQSEALYICIPMAVLALTAIGIRFFIKAGRA